MTFWPPYVLFLHKIDVFLLKFIGLSTWTSVTIFVIHLIKEFLSYKAKNNHCKSLEKHYGRPLDLLGHDDNYANMFVFQPIMTTLVNIRLSFISISNMEPL